MEYMPNESADYEKFSLVQGGLIYRLTSLFAGSQKSRKANFKLSLFLIVLTWLPMLFMAIANGTFVDEDTSIGFLEDFSFHVRFLLILPFLILIEPAVNAPFVDFFKRTDDLIPNEQQESFNKLVGRINALTSSVLPEVLFLIFYIGGILVFSHDLFGTSADKRYLLNGTDIEWAGWYYILIALPIFLLVIFRWFWRWLLWLYSLMVISKFSIKLDYFHADKMAGLEYLNLTPLAFSFLLIAPSAILSSSIGIDIIYRDHVFSEYIFQIAIYVLALPVALYVPLLIFIPELIRAKTKGIMLFGSLLRKHNWDYAAKWIDINSTNKEPVLGSMDNSSLADINGSYTPIEGMRMFPINLQMITLSFVMNLLPYIPLVFTYYTISELITDILKSLLS
jgi:hypothetical protein